MNTGNIVLIAALVVFVIVRRFAGRAVDPRRSMVMPAALAVYGFVLLRQVGHLSPTDFGWLTVDGTSAVLTGLARGTSVHLYERGGVLWQRYRPATLAWWIAAITIRFGIAAAAISAGADRKVMDSSFVLMFGISLAAEAAVVLPRAFAKGVPIAPRA
jgi:hypothetical protein